jgi:hypothetical protein
MVTACGLNEAVGYLVLGCGTGHNNSLTSWSTKAIMQYAGLGWNRAKAALTRLIDNGFILRTENHTTEKPRYRLETYANLATKKPPADPEYYEMELLAEIASGKQPTNKAGRNRAERLRQRGLLVRDAEGVYKLPPPGAEDSSDNLIWLPNAIVTGTSGEDEPPVRRLRSAGCVWTLRLFVDLYQAQNLRDDGGISPNVIRQNFERRKIGEQGAYTVWGFKLKNLTLWYAGPFAPHEFRQKAKPEDNIPAWDSEHLLQRMGLLSFVPHIFENDTNAAEPIHVYGLGETAEDPIEEEIGSEADQAARAMCLPSKVEEAEEEGFQYFCPVLNTKPNTQMIGVARLTYRPHTKRTKAWFAELQETAPVWIETFQELAEKSEIAANRRLANYA